jgi:hypothetical protein
MAADVVSNWNAQSADKLRVSEVAKVGNWNGKSGKLRMLLRMLHVEHYAVICVRTKSE